MSYNVGIKNRFAELDSDTEAVPTQHVAEKVETVTPVVTKTRQERPARNGDRAPRPEGERRVRTERTERPEGERSQRPRGPRPDRKERAPRKEEAVAQEGENVENTDASKPIHNNRRGRGRAAPRTGRHDGLDRNSTNFNPRMKKDGAGAHNWGKDGEVVAEKTEAPVETESPVADAVAEVEQPEEVEAEVEEKPVEKVYTYNDYVKDQEAKRANVPKKVSSVQPKSEITETIENGKFKLHVKSRDNVEKVETENKPLVNNKIHLHEFIQAQGGRVPTVYNPKDDRRARDNNRRAPRDNNRRGTRENNRSKPISFDATAFPSL